MVFHSDTCTRSLRLTISFLSSPRLPNTAPLSPLHTAAHHPRTSSAKVLLLWCFPQWIHYDGKQVRAESGSLVKANAHWKWVRLFLQHKWSSTPGHYSVDACVPLCWRLRAVEKRRCRADVPACHCSTLSRHVLCLLFQFVLPASYAGAATCRRLPLWHSCSLSAAMPCLVTFL